MATTSPRLSVVTLVPGQVENPVGVRLRNAAFGNLVGAMQAGARRKLKLKPQMKF